MLGNGGSKQIRERLQSLEGHLQTENPLLVDAVQSFRKLDKVGYRMGLINRDQSFATRIPWWPLVSVLGTFSAGKSTFINHYLGQSLQLTGTQAVDDKFTVICYASDGEARDLPGIALDADPRFPFYQMSEELDKVTLGDREHIDAYLRLKTCPSEALRGTILIDSPGFDADAQRTATLRITDHIIDLSDLVLVLFDARHPEPGAMQDTLSHLVGNSMGREDSSKFMYILNQIDVTAREDNPEDVVAAWQRALAQEGLTAGRFYSIYNPDAAVPIDDPARRKRFEGKRDRDLSQIHQRMQRVGVERAYRIIANLDKTARAIEDQYVPRLKSWLGRWARGVWWRDALLFGLAVAVVLGASIGLGYWQGLQFQPPEWMRGLADSPVGLIYVAVVLLVLAFWLHFTARRWSAAGVRKRIVRNTAPGPEREFLLGGFAQSTRPWRSVFARGPAGWGRSARKRLQQVMADADRFIQMLNDRFTNPSGGDSRAADPTPLIPESEQTLTGQESPAAESTSNPSPGGETR